MRTLLNRLPLRVRKWLLWTATAFILYVLVGFFLLPPIIKWQLRKQLLEITKRQVAVRQVKVNPLVFSLTIRGLLVAEPEGRPFAAWEELYVNFQTSSLFRWAWTFREIRLADPFGEVILFENGRLNFADMLEAPPNRPPKKEPASIPRVRIFHLEITNGFVALEDRTLPSLFRTEYRPINLNLKDFTTRPDAETPYSFRAESDAGRSINWAGDLTVQPLSSAGHLEITGVKLSRYQPYLEQFTTARLTNGLADMQLNYRFAAGTNGLDLFVTNGAVQVAQVQIIDPATGETVSGLGGLAIRQAEFNWRERSARLGSVKATEASVLARLNKDGTLNLLNLVKFPKPATNTPAKATAPPTEPPVPWTGIVDEFVVERMAVIFEDLMRRTSFRTELKPIEFSLKQFTTKADSDATYSFRIASEAAESFEGSGTVSINPVRSSGEVKVGAVDVKKYLPYAEDFFRGRILSGKIEASVPYRFAIATNNLLAGVTNLAVKLTDLEVQLPENPETVTHVSEIGIERVEASLDDRRGRVGLFKADGGSVLLRRHKDGSINLLGLLARPKKSASDAGSDPSPPPAASNGGDQRGTKPSPLFAGVWSLNLDELQLRNYSVKVEDLMPEKASALQLDELHLSVKGVSTALSNPVTAEVSFRLNETGTIAAGGQATMAPLAAEMDVAVTNLDLRAAQPYLDPFVALNLGSGALSTSGHLRFQTNDTAKPLLAFAGDLRVANFVASDTIAFKEFVRFDELGMAGIDAALLPTRVKVDKIHLVLPKASALIRTNKEINFTTILKSAPPASSATNSVTAETNAAVTQPSAGSATNSPAETLPIEVGTLELDQAGLVFTDESVQPYVVFTVEEVSGTVKKLSSALDTTADVDLHGKFDAQSTFAVNGRLNPYSMFVDLTITNANTQLTPFTGYMEKYGGFPLHKGRVTTSLRYHVEGKALAAENKIQVDQLTLGARNNSPDATTLPVKLGVALLKDSNGRIELDVPVNGKLDDPEFKLGPIIFKVIGNIIVKAAASPFKLLGSLVGGGGDELGFVEFSPGGTNTVEAEAEKLGKLASALVKRPALNLEIEGAVDPARDRAALARLKLHEQLKAKRLAELTAKGKAPTDLETFQVEPEEQQRLLRAAFVEQFGTNIAQVIEANRARLAATTNQPPAPTKPKGNFFQQTVKFLGNLKPSPKAERQLSKADRQALKLATPDVMEALVAEKIAVTDEDFGQLMTARARWVQDWFVQNGQIGADRLLLVAPKPVDEKYRGESKVTLSLN